MFVRRWISIKTCKTNLSRHKMYLNFVTRAKQRLSPHNKHNRSDPTASLTSQQAKIMCHLIDPEMLFSDASARKNRSYQSERFKLRSNHLDRDL